MRSVYFAFTLPIALAAQQPHDPPRAPTPAQPREACAIAGQVLNAVNGRPLAKASIVVFPIGKPRASSYTTTSTAGGRFVLEDIEPGKYRMSASRSGYARMEYGARVPGRPGTTLSLDSAQQVGDVVFRLMPQSVVTGRILDEDGEPIPHIEVHLMVYGYAYGKRQLEERGSGSTNDLGEYRIFGMAPGRYVLSATFLDESELQYQTTNAAGGERHYGPTYYPGTTNPAGAAPIELKPGAQLRGVDLVLIKTRTVSLRGRVFHAVSQKPVENGTVTVAPRIWNDMWSDLSANIEKGSFELHGLMPGAYVLLAYGGSEGETFSGRQEVDVGAGDVDNLAIEVRPHIELKGRLRADGPADPLLAEARIVLQSASPIGAGGSSGGVKADGSFTVPRIAPEHYTVRVYGLPENYYVKSALLGGKDVLEPGFDVTDGVTGRLDVIVGGNGAEIEGTVLNSGEQPAPGSTVVLAPDEPRRAQLQLYKEVTTDQRGRFSVKGIAPGQYKLFAWEDAEAGAYRDPEFLKPFETRGEPIAIREGAHERRQLHVLK